MLRLGDAIAAFIAFANELLHDCPRSRGYLQEQILLLSENQQSHDLPVVVRLADSVLISVINSSVSASGFIQPSAVYPGSRLIILVESPEDDSIYQYIRPRLGKVLIISLNWNFSDRRFTSLLVVES
jgi:hypothetical protein